MSRRILAALVVAASAFVAGTGLANAQDQWLNVPFQFSVAGKDMPAGRYSVEVTKTDVLIFRQAKAATAVEVPAMTRLALSGNSPEDVARLVFDKVGDKYFVSEVLAGGPRRVPGLRREGGPHSRGGEDLEGQQLGRGVAADLVGQTCFVPRSLRGFLRERKEPARRPSDRDHSSHHAFNPC